MVHQGVADQLDFVERVAVLASDHPEPVDEVPVEHEGHVVEEQPLELVQRGRVRLGGGLVCAGRLEPPVGGDLRLNGGRRVVELLPRVVLSTGPSRSQARLADRLSGEHEWIVLRPGPASRPDACVEFLQQARSKVEAAAPLTSRFEIACVDKESQVAARDLVRHSGLAAIGQVPDPEPKRRVEEHARRPFREP